MDLPQPSEVFDRIYSPPEPPPRRRRPAPPIDVVTTALVLAVAAFAVLIVALVVGGNPAWPLGDAAGGGGRSTGSNTPVAGAADPGALPAGESWADSLPRAWQGRIIGTLPPPCEMIRPVTVNRLVPRSRTRHSANTTLATCTFAESGAGTRWLRVEARIFDPVGGIGPGEAAADFLGAQQTRIAQVQAARVVSLEHQEDLGDEAYRCYKIDNGRRAAVGEVAFRIGNAVVTVDYGGAVPDGADRASDERAYVTAAIHVAREVLGALE